MAKKKAAKKKSAKRATAKKTAPKKNAAKKSAKRPAPKNGDIDALRTQLQALLEQPETEKRVLKLLLSLNEDQRRALAPICLKQIRAVKKNEWIKEHMSFCRNPLVSVATVATFCTASFTEIKKLGRHGTPEDDVILEVLAVRKPTWGSQFVDLLLGRSYFWNSWRLCRELVRKGYCQKPDNPRYFTGMITGLVGRWSRGETNALAELKKDPGLLKDEVWRLFEYDGEDDNTLANIDRWEDSNWSGAFVTLADEGKLSRAKLLDSALGALELGFNHYRARWFFDFFDRLEPTDKELKKRAARILGLMDNPAPNVAQWAFDKQQLLIERKLIKDVLLVINASAPLMGARHRKTITQVLKLFDQLAEDSPNVTRDVCLVAAEGLSHEKAAVQKDTFNLIEKHGSADDPELSESVERFATVAAATIKKQIQAWLASGSAAEVAKPESQKRSGSSSAFKTSDLKKFDAEHIRLLSIEPLVEQLKSPSADAMIPAATFDGTEFPRLDPDRRLTPIEDLDELLETLGRVLEDDSLVDDAERTIDGLARLHVDRPNDFERLIAPLHKRAQQLIKRSHAPFAGQGAVGDICGLILAWKRGEKITTKTGVDKWKNRRTYIKGLYDEPINTWLLDGVPLTFMSQRMLDVSRYITGGQPQQLLSIPTHAGGWIDPATLVERLNGLKNEPPPSDVILTLLRLAPDGRSEALKKLKPKLKGEWLNAIKHGLGANGIRVGKTAALWAAAARCRSPFEDDSKVVKGFPKLGPGGGKAARYEARFWQKQMSWGPARYFRIETTEKPPKNLQTDIPSQLFQRNRDDESSVSFHDIGTTPGSIRWLATMWPAAFESFFATGAECIGDNLDWHEAAWHNRCFMEPLLDSDIPLLHMGGILLLCGLAAKEPGEHGLATDIAILAINDGRLGTDNLAELLITGFTSGHFNLPRLANRLHDVANTSSLHTFVVMHAAEKAVGALDAADLPRGIGDIFELMSETATQIERGIQDSECRALLESLKGSNKAAKAARQLLAIETRLDPREIFESAIALRKERLEQWQRR